MDGSVTSGTLTISRRLHCRWHGCVCAPWSAPADVSGANVSTGQKFVSEEKQTFQALHPSWRGWACAPSSVGADVSGRNVSTGQKFFSEEKQTFQALHRRWRGWA